jgi:hypothetical protein
MASSCLWYRNGKNPEPDLGGKPVSQYDAEGTEGGRLDIGEHDFDYLDEMMPGDVQEEMEDIFQFIPTTGSAAAPEAGPSNFKRSRHVPDAIHLDQGDDQRVEDINLNAGVVIRMEQNLHQQWHATFGHKGEDVDMDAGNGDSNEYAPFASEMDWKIAQWAIKDGPGNAAFDRLLAIPQVSLLPCLLGRIFMAHQVREKLGLSYKNIRGLHKLVDEIPARGTWQHRDLSFADRPDEKYRIHFRDPIEAIRSLWADPTHAKDFVYQPRQVFSDQGRKNRIYSEMWTGKWWNAVQKVRYYP